MSFIQRADNIQRLMMHVMDLLTHNEIQEEGYIQQRPNALIKTASYFSYLCPQVATNVAEHEKAIQFFRDEIRRLTFLKHYIIHDRLIREVLDHSDYDNCTNEVLLATATEIREDHGRFIRLIRGRVKVEHVSCDDFIYLPIN